MTDCKSYLQGLNLPDDRLFYESFSTNATILPGKAPTGREYSIHPPSLSRPSPDKGGNYRINFAKSGKTITADGAATLLELAENSGIAISHECRAGHCGECMVKCLKGHIEMIEQAEIDHKDRTKGWVYACCAYPASNVVLDA